MIDLDELYQAVPVGKENAETSRQIWKRFGVWSANGIRLHLICLLPRVALSEFAGTCLTAASTGGLGIDGLPDPGPTRFWRGHSLSLTDTVEIGDLKSDRPLFEKRTAQAGKPRPSKGYHSTASWITEAHS
jgi:hypothetical protein